MIRRNRNLIAMPLSLDPTNPTMVAEHSHNQALVAKNMHLPWTTWSSEMEFTCYIGSDDDVKAALSKIFFNKCAYCEGPLGIQYMHAEHYRPKKETDKADCTLQRGYWWLGAAWSNLLPSCVFCNNSPGKDHDSGEKYHSGKGNRFPLLPGSPRASQPNDEIYELPVLLNPAEDEPADYLTFRRFDEYFFAVVKHLPTVAMQMRALGSIEIYGLNNPGLVRQRTTHLKRAMGACRALLGTLNRLNSAIANGEVGEPLSTAENEVAVELGDLYNNYLAPDKEYLHATVRCVEDELRKAGLSIKALLGGRNLHLPSYSLT